MSDDFYEYDKALSKIADLEHENFLLKARIAELEAQQRWIPVGERLPDTNANVMVNASNEQLIGSYHSKHGIWYIPSVDRPKVSHWMPLPEPPIVYGKESK